MTGRSQPLSAWDQINTELIDCTRCPRLVAWREEVARVRRKQFEQETYWGRPVPNFGDPTGRVLIVGLAPAAHGANRTGRMFTGDRSGEWLYRALFRAGFANQPTSVSSDDGLVLSRCAITAACHCAPPDNAPTLDEQAACRPYLVRLIESYQPQGYVALGGLAWNAVLKAVAEQSDSSGKRSKRPVFGHGAETELSDGRWMIGSYHPSQQNTFTGRLTEPMFDAVFNRVRERLAE